MFVGRTRELGALRSAFDLPDASVIRVTGLRGVGKTELVRRATDGFPTIYHRAPPLPDPDQRAALGRALRDGLPALGERAPGALDATASWDTLFSAAGEAAAGRTLVLVLDDAHRLEQARSRFGGALEAALARATARSGALHVVLVGGAYDSPSVQRALTVAPLRLRAAAPLLPGASARRKIQAYAVFGGVPAHLQGLDPHTGVVTNLRRAFFDPGARLRDRGLDLLELDLQTPSRYAAILEALAAGEGDWKRVHAGVRDLTGSGQVAPYLRRLEELGLVEVRRSLDAAPESRARRYRLTDPFLVFWFRFVLPERHRLPDPHEARVLGDDIRTRMGGHVEAIFAEVCRRYMASDAMETIGANAREVGSLWGPDVEVEVAGILRSGASFYGVARAHGSTLDAPDVRALDEAMRRTRYGYGRERRLRLMFSGDGFGPGLERAAARRDDAFLIGPEALVGEA